MSILNLRGSQIGIKMSRCGVYVFDYIKDKRRKCLHKRKWGPVCSYHARKYIVKIQAVWRAYSTKKRIFLFKTLPEEIWNIILKYIIERNNTIKLLESHERIYTKRILYVYTNFLPLWYQNGSDVINEHVSREAKKRAYIRAILKTY